MKPKQLVALAVALVAVLGVVMVMKNRRDKAGQGGAAVVGNVVFPNLDVEKVARVVIVGPEEKVTLARKEGNGDWGVEDRGGFAADFSKVRTLVLDLSKLKIAQTAGAGPSQFGRLGLLAPDSAEGTGEEKGTAIEFQAAGGEAIAKALVGKDYKTGGGASGGMATGRYLKVDGASDIYVISDQLYSLQADPAAWLMKESFRVEKPKSITVTYPEEGESFTLSKEEESGQFALKDISETEELDASAAGGFGNIFSSGSFADVLVGDAATDEKTGLDKSTKIEVETFDGFHYVIEIGKQISETPEGEETPASPSVRYPVRYTVSAELPKERKVEDEESEEDKKLRDSEFELKSTTQAEKLAKESALAGTIFLMENWVIDQVLKKREDLIKKPEPEGEGSDGATAAPGIPGLPSGISVTTPPVAVPPAGGANQPPKEPITATTPPVSIQDAIPEETKDADTPDEGQAPTPEEGAADETPEAGTPDEGGDSSPDSTEKAPGEEEAPEQ